jgi:AcrR family transcriptional regulator
MPKLNPEALEDRRQHILRAAEVCFARDGFHRTTIAHIRRQANVSAGAIYTYFPNKEAIVRAGLEKAQAERRAQLEAASTGGPTSALPQALVLLDLVNAVFRSQGQRYARVDMNLWAEAVHNPQVAHIAETAISEATNMVAVAVEQILRASGQRPDVTLRAVASVLVSIFLGIEVQTAVGIALDPNEIVRVLTELFAVYLKRRSAPRKSLRKAPKKKGAKKQSRKD